MTFQGRPSQEPAGTIPRTGCRYVSTWAVTRWRSWLVRHWVLCSIVRMSCTPFYRRATRVFAEHRLTHFLLSPHSAESSCAFLSSNRNGSLCLDSSFDRLGEGQVIALFSSERQFPATRIFIDFLFFRHSAAVTDTVLDIPVMSETGALGSAALLTACSLAVNTEFPLPSLRQVYSIKAIRSFVLHDGRVGGVSTSGTSVSAQEAHQATD